MRKCIMDGIKVVGFEEVKRERSAEELAWISRRAAAIKDNLKRTGKITREKI